MSSQAKDRRRPVNRVKEPFISIDFPLFSEIVLFFPPLIFQIQVKARLHALKGRRRWRPDDFSSAFKFLIKKRPSTWHVAFFLRVQNAFIPSIT